MPGQQEHVTGKLIWLPLPWKPVSQHDPDLTHFKSFQLHPDGVYNQLCLNILADTCKSAPPL